MFTQRGLKLVHAIKPNESIYSNWWKTNNKQCISVRISDGVVKSITNAMPFDCMH